MIIEMKKQNDKPLTDEEAILKKLRINDIAEITKEGLKKLSSLHIDPEVSKKLIEQIPHFSELAKAVMHDYSLSFQKVLESDTASSPSLQACSDTLAACRLMLEDNSLNFEQKREILEYMKNTGERLAEIERERREHNMKLFLIQSAATAVFTAAVSVLYYVISAAASSSEA